MENKRIGSFDLSDNRTVFHFCSFLLFILSMLVTCCQLNYLFAKCFSSCYFSTTCFFSLALPYHANIHAVLFIYIQTHLSSINTPSAECTGGNSGFSIFGFFPQRFFDWIDLQIFWLVENLLWHVSLGSSGGCVSNKYYEKQVTYLTDVLYCSGNMYKFFL